MNSEQVFYLLRKLFTKFDQKCQENNVYKLYTIGDCYVVMGLVNIKDRNYVKEAMNGNYLAMTFKSNLLLKCLKK